VSFEKLREDVYGAYECMNVSNAKFIEFSEAYESGARKQCGGSTGGGFESQKRVSRSFLMRTNRKLISI
jgi:hypothetical protein